MKRAIAIITIGIFLTSCAGGWSCKKRYCNTTNKKSKTEITKLPTKEEVVVQP
ncbi:hypothetical protein [Pseudofulvibacter geojedonensis]|uniref:Lipoprotein n=1 Tax=Pseudofulvibacter geojedonensis TaxID=1123758 RepID=A0ABW3I1I2_9FLAO